MPDPPDKPFRRATLPTQSRLPAVEVPGHRSIIPEGDREFLLKTFREQTRVIVEKFDSLESTTKAGFEAHDRRLLDLEKAQLEAGRTGLLVQKIDGKFDLVMAANRAQDIDIGRLSAQVTTSIRPIVKSEGQDAGKVAGKAAGNAQGKVWGAVTILVGIVVTSTMQYCQQQLAPHVAPAPNGAAAH
jgi:hypothetical protein